MSNPQNTPSKEKEFDEHDESQTSRIYSLYQQVFNRFRKGGYEIYNPRLFHYLTVDKFAKWIKIHQTEFNN